MPAPLVYEGKIPVLFVPAITDINAPSAAGDLAGAVPLQSYVPKDGIQFPSGRNMTDTSSIDRVPDSEYPGSTSGPLVMTFKRKNRAGLEVAHTTFKDGLVEGFVVFGFQGSADQVGDEVDIYQIVGHIPVKSNPATNTEQRFVVTGGVQDQALNVLVVA